MTLKVVLDEGAYKPVRAYPTDAGLDLFSTVDVWVHPGQHVKIDTGVRAQIPEGYFGLVASKSSLMDKGITSRGIIDSSFRGTIKAVLFNHGDEGYLVRRGDKVTQLLIIPIELCDIEIVDELDETERGTGGFGSTGIR